jgi:hypothetical protein
MAKKILVLCAAIMAFAVVPSVASATNSPELVETGGSKVSGLIEATNIGKTVMTGPETSTLLTCDIATLTGEVSKNDGSNVEGTISAGTFKNSAASTCSGTLGNTLVTPSPVSGNGLPWCIRSTSGMLTHEFQLRGNKCSEAARPIRFGLHVPVVGLCEYQKTSPVIGKFSTGIGATTLSISHQEFPKLATSSSFCPSVGFLDMTFMLETDGTSTRVDIT